MFRSILVGYDGTRPARDALALGRALAGPTTELTLCCVHSFVPDPDGPPRLPVDPDARTITVTATSPAAGLHAVAESEHADLLVVGSSKRSAAGRILLGSTTTQALNAPPCAVAVATPGLARTPAALRRIVVGFDGGAESRVALRTAAALAAEAGARLDLVTVVEPATQALGWAGAYVYPEYRADALAIAREDQATALADLRDDVDAHGEVVEGLAARVLVAAAADADLLVLGSRGYGPLRRVLLGGVSTRVAGATDCPLLVLPRTTTAVDPRAQPPMSLRSSA